MTEENSWEMIVGRRIKMTDDRWEMKEEYS